MKREGLDLKRHRAWQNMLKHACYHRQHVHPQWRDYTKFAEDVGLPPTSEYWLCRLDPPQGFKPGNVYWLKARYDI